MKLCSWIIQVLAQIYFWKCVHNIRVWYGVLIFEMKTIIYIVLTFHLNRTWTFTFRLRLLKKVLISHTKAIVKHARLCMITCVGGFAYLFFININIFLRSILLLCVLMLIATVWKSLHANWFDHTFYCRPGAWNLVQSIDSSSLGCTRSYRTSCSLIIIQEIVIKFCMRFENTLRSLVHFLYVVVAVLHAFVRLTVGILASVGSSNNGEAIDWGCILN